MRPPPLDHLTVGSVMNEAWSRSWKTRWRAVARSLTVASAITPPLFGLRSKRGKFELDTSTRIRWPASKTFAVATRSTSIS